MPPLAIDEAAARVQAGCPTDRTGAGIPGRFGIRTIRNARFPMKAPGGLQFRQRAEKRERRSKTNSPGIVLSVRRRTTPPGDRTGNAAGERAERPRVRERGKLVRPVSGLRKIGPSRQKCRTNPEYLPNPITHFVTPAVLGGVFGSYFPMAGNPLAWSRLENACTWHIRYINAYNRSAKYFSIPKPG